MVGPDSNSDQEPSVQEAPKHILLRSIPRNSMTTRSGGSDGAGGTIKQEDRLNIDCRTFFESNDRDLKVLFAMMIGVSPREDLKLDFNFFDVDHPPFSKHKRDFKPTLKVMQSEVIRRASNVKATRMPRPSQWPGEKLMDALTAKFPPILSADDVAFLSAECNELHYATTDRNMQEAVMRERHSGWKSSKSYMRMFHVFVYLRNSFVARKRDGSSAPTRHPEFWEEAIKKFNDDTWVPKSMALPSVPELSEPLDLPLLFPEKVSQSELARAFCTAKYTLKDVVERWHDKINPTPLHKEEDIVEQWNYHPGDIAGSGNVRDTKDYVWYIWDYANRNKILGSCLLDASDRFENSFMQQLASQQAVPVVAGATDPIPMVADHGTVVHSRDSLVLRPDRRMSHVLERKPACNHSGKAKDDENFLAIQELHLEQMRSYNTMLNEVSEIEEKHSGAALPELRATYQRYYKRKKESLSGLKRQLETSESYAETISKKLALPCGSGSGQTSAAAHEKEAPPVAQQNHTTNDQHIPPPGDHAAIHHATNHAMGHQAPNQHTNHHAHATSHHVHTSSDHTATEAHTIITTSVEQAVDHAVEQAVDHDIEVGSPELDLDIESNDGDMSDGV